MMKTKVKNLFCLIIYTLLLSGCRYFSSYEVEIQNNSSYTASNLNILVGGVSLNVDRIEPGKKATVTYDPIQDSSLKINFQTGQDSKTHTCTGDVYVTPGAGDDFVVTLIDNGECIVYINPHRKHKY